MCDSVQAWSRWRCASPTMGILASIKQMSDEAVPSSFKALPPDELSRVALCERAIGSR